MSPESRSAALPVSESTNETITKSSESPMHTRSRRRTSGAAAIVHEATPIPEAREVSMMLKNPPFSPEGISGSHTGVDMPSRDDKGVLLTSTPRNMLPNFSKPSVVVTTTAMKKWQSNIQEAAHKLLTISRLVCIFYLEFCANLNTRIHRYFRSRSTSGSSQHCLSWFASFMLLFLGR